VGGTESFLRHMVDAMDEERVDIPIGWEHLKMIETLASVTARRSSDGVGQANQSALIGTALSALYQAATCHRGCRNTGHLLEALSGRAYNLGSAAYLLIARGFYDEALNLVRGIGEIANLISLSAVDKEVFQKWVDADARTRRRDFTPMKIRKVLEQKGPELMIADQEWYSRLCEAYTHVGPATFPNMHNGSGIPTVGGIHQSEGVERALEELSNIVVVLALQICKYFDFDDLFDQLERELRA